MNLDLESIVFPVQFNKGDQIVKHQSRVVVTFYLRHKMIEEAVGIVNISLAKVNKMICCRK